MRPMIRFSCSLNPALRQLYKTLGSPLQSDDGCDIASGPMIPLLGISFSRSSKQSTITQALGMGYTALFASCHLSEKKIGQALYSAVSKDSNEASHRGFISRPSLFLSTQMLLNTHLLPAAGQAPHDDHGFIQGHYYSAPREKTRDPPLGMKSIVKNACLASIANLNGDEYLDLVLMPWQPDEDTMIKTWDAMGHLVDEGLIRSIGVSGFTSQARLEPLLQACTQPSVNQIDILQLKNKALIAFAEDKGIHIIATLPPQESPSSEVTEVATRLGRSAEEVLARWVVEHEASVILKDPGEDMMRRCLKVFDWRLSAEDIERLDSIKSAVEMGRGMGRRITPNRMSLGEKYDAFGAAGISFK